MIKAVLIDDEKHSLATLAWKLEKFCPDVSVAAQFNDPMEALQYLRSDPPDLVFLDIEMPRLNGFEVLEEMGGPLPFEVIFTTAYDEFGIRAVKVNALDYLLKPIQNQELKEAIAKFQQKKGDKQVDVLFSNKKEEGVAMPDRVALATKESIEFVAPDEIILCTSDSNYTMVYLADGRKKLISRTLKDVEEWLLPFNFYRAHHSHLVNLKHIREFVRADGGYLVLSNKMTLPVARNRKDELMKLM